MAQDNEILGQLLTRKDAEINELNSLLASWKPKLELLEQKEKEVGYLKVDVSQSQSSFLVRYFKQFIKVY